MNNNLQSAFLSKTFEYISALVSNVDSIKLRISKKNPILANYTIGKCKFTDSSLFIRLSERKPEDLADENFYSRPRHHR